MKSMRTTAWVLALSTCLIGATPAFSQTEKGYDGDQSVKSGQRDNEDRETNFDWIGLFGLLGLTGLIGPRQRQERPVSVVRKTLIATTIIATAGLLSMAEPAMSRALQESDGDNSSVASDNDDGHTNFGWVGLLGLAGLLGLRKRRSSDNTLTR
ncbi:WGxxGxxG family protein [Spirosoma utsteinense]|uniref:MYXO-CTERM domain-containing protein n=1 Tax=Spirosoma utsteinense TaxID=2585773 RepID=A0ABR6WD44_9BACT|nr:WGxxGxxG family protein [Spirosoma utsteinense]MBC3787486.1 MYXO-CTERM domain-containing protein [Spirosoma utsteinense]MBC3794423.1 MYXO-CTERM domain-containing protein [Spirosoma utsteinense]